ncbi:hypothetical protein BC937DRAFT_91880 [Endogone sp. FLAS-F59071]|nr:hypothetical protein BC937DRAFT_91880 [Endogone sp. FLAS-F59071]|eukprot:RUS15862.1 hypothetical protein BC937DRAFT_91880 [Endogone sp. FLAS-F59071]
MATIYEDSKRRSPRLLRASSTTWIANVENSQTSNSKIDGSTSIIDQIKERVRNAISREKLRDPELNVVEVDLSGILDYKRSDVLTDIHETFAAERIDEKLFIKFDGPLKEIIHRRIANSIEPQLPGWSVNINTICEVNGNEFRPDIGAWNPPPTRLQSVFPLIHHCPHPLLWIEVAWNNSDHDNAIAKISYILPFCPNTEFVLIGLPHTGALFPGNPTPGVASAAIGVPLSARPHYAPYVGYWAPGAALGAVQWHLIQWNQHLPLAIGINLELNLILNELA